MEQKSLENYYHEYLHCSRIVHGTVAAEKYVRIILNFFLFRFRFLNDLLYFFPEILKVVILNLVKQIFQFCFCISLCRGVLTDSGNG